MIINLNVHVFFLIVLQVKVFFDSFEGQGQELRIIQVVLEVIQKNIRWLERNLHVLRKWLVDNVQRT